MLLSKTTFTIPSVGSYINFGVSAWWAITGSYFLEYYKIGGGTEHSGQKCISSMKVVVEEANVFFSTVISAWGNDCWSWMAEFKA